MKFKLGQKVYYKDYRGKNLLGKVIRIDYGDYFPIIVEFNSQYHSFTKDGRYLTGGEINLFHQMPDKINKLLKL